MIAQGLQRYRYVERTSFLGEKHHLERKHIYLKNYIYLVEAGELEYTTEHGTYRAVANHLVLLKKGTCVIRRVISPIHLHIFEVKELGVDFDEPMFTENVSRIQSNISLLHRDYTDVLRNFDHIRHILRDILYVYQVECRFDSNQVADERIVQALKIMHRQFGNGVKVAEIAEEVHLSYPHFLRLFEKNTRMTPIEYLNRIKLERAKTLLDTSNLLIEEIAEECGFQNLYYFSNFFKKETGVSPKEYRRLGIPL